MDNTGQVERHYYHNTNSNSGIAFLFGAILLLAVFFALFYYGGSILNSFSRTTQPQVNVPDKVDVNINHTK